MGVWQGVAMDSLKFHPRPPYATLLRPAGGPSLKRPYDRKAISGVARPQGGADCRRLLPLWTPQFQHPVSGPPISLRPGWEGDKADADSYRVILFV
jgi:hypothetical protein